MKDPMRHYLSIIPVLALFATGCAKKEDAASPHQPTEHAVLHPVPHSIPSAASTNQTWVPIVSLMNPRLSEDASNVADRIVMLLAAHDIQHSGFYGSLGVTLSVKQDQAERAWTVLTRNRQRIPAVIALPDIEETPNKAIDGD